VGQQYDNRNKGAMFKNSRKTPRKHPDYTGTIDVDGTEHWISGWINEAGPNARNPGQKYLKLSISEKEDIGENSTRLRQNPAEQELDDDIPF
jgi:hypothetical protein